MPQQISVLRLVMCAIISFVLFISVIGMSFSGIPVAYVGLAFGPTQAAITAALVLGLVGVLLTPDLAISFAISILLPLLCLIRLSLLSRRSGTDVAGKPIYEFYPANKIALWTIGTMALVTAAVHFSFGGYDGGLPRLFAQAIRETPPVMDLLKQIRDFSEPEQVDALAQSSLLLGFAVWPVLLMANMVMGHLFAGIRLRNMRPIENYDGFRLPAWPAGILLAALLGGWLAEGWFSLMLYTIALMYLIAYFLVGLAVIYVVIRNWEWGSETYALIGTYLVLITASWVIVPVALLGLLDVRLNLRRLPEQNEKE